MMNELKDCIFIEKDGGLSLRLCWALNEKVAQTPNERVKGLVIFELTKMGEFNYTAGIIYRTSPKDKGVLLNFCPWCGKSIIVPHFQTDPDPEEEPQ